MLATNISLGACFPKAAARGVVLRIYIYRWQCYRSAITEDQILRNRVDQVIKALKKRVFIPIVCVCAFAIWVVLCSKYYESYWGGTIQRVQNVDFNMLHHTLPPSLSYLVLTGQDEAVQKVLDSTFGLFGIVITDPQGEHILYKTEAEYHGKTWQKSLSINSLHASQIEGALTQHYDLLTDPPPTMPQWATKGPRHAADERVGMPPQGRVIGRVYYVRPTPPPFWGDVLASFQGDPFEMSGSKRGYRLQTLNVLAGGVIVILVMLLRRQAIVNKEKELVALERELAAKRKLLEQLTSDLASQRKRKEWLEQEAERAYQRAYKLKESLEKLKEAFFFDDAQQARPAGGKEPISVRPPLHPPSKLIEEIETLLPDLTNNAKILRSQAEVLQTYCSQLELRQAEMQRILERNRGPRPLVQPSQPHYHRQLAPDQRSQ